MSANPETQSNVVGIGKKQDFLLVHVKGKIQSSRRWRDSRHTRVITPNTGEYSRPQIIEVRSKEPLGEVDDVVTFNARLGGGYGRTAKVADKETGEVRDFIPVNMFLDYVE